MKLITFAIATTTLFSPVLASANEQMRITFSPTCPVSGGEKESALAVLGANILVNVASRFVGDTVDAISKYLTTAEAKSYTATGRMNAFAVRDAKGALRINPSEICVLVAIGQFGDGNRTDPFSNVPQELSKATIEVAKRTRLADSPQLYFEGVFKAADSGDAFTLVPKYWYYPQFLQKSGFAHSKDRDVLFKLELAAPGKTAFASWQMDWASISEGGIATTSVVDRVLPWSPLPQEIGGRSSAGTFFPVNANAIFTETAKPNTLAKYLGEALAGQKQTIVSEAQSVLQSALSEQVRLDAAKALLAGTETKLKAYNEAYAAAKDAQSKFDAAKGTPGRAAALAAAKLAYGRLTISTAELQNAYQSAGLGPFPEFPVLPELPAA
jgi:hypothetical protein